ncbi:tumor necrosis factor receptor superfamily member 6B-like [Cottoperca gobio]|uniref:Tumor necrosis factor receptor superfamily member 6B-like n=1 Tax=Cottoperca gobio TaxID=56716 RepID=A0A6J2RCG9_COTGO|nr:tumor necrosis factor receptor superfamily member 6B-like [Cottoperca gobio]
MHIISMFLLPVMFLLSGVLCGVSAVSRPTFEHRDRFTGATLVCEKCPPGTRLAAYCTASTPTACVPCRSRSFTELWNYLPKCLYCNNFCTENQEVETECTATTNRVCRCTEGFYLTADFCRRHSECGPGNGVQTKGTSQMDTVCEQCSDGYFSDTSSALKSCVKQQECASGQIALLPGSINQDTMCGSCKELENEGETLRTFFSGFFSRNKMRLPKMKAFIARYIHTTEDNDTTLPKQRVMDQFRAWLAHAPEEQLRKLPQMLKASKLCSRTEQLEQIVNEIKQQSPNCTLTLLDVKM